MTTDTLSPEKDPMGAAIADYYAHGRASKLRVFSSLFEEDEIPVKQLFRTEQQMSAIEKTALRLAQGKVLDVGAGSGVHTLPLQARGLETVAIDVSPLAIEVMRKRGVKDARLANFFCPTFAGSFDTILMLMNGSGIIGRTENMPLFFDRLRALLAPGGHVLMDSSDLSYLYEDEEEGMVIDLAAEYYGQVDFHMQYKQVTGDTFDWLYIDFDTLSLYAEQNGFAAELIMEGKHYDYLARISRKV